jgi:hypothetical protein
MVCILDTKGVRYGSSLHPYPEIKMTQQASVT